MAVKNKKVNTAHLKEVAEQYRKTRTGSGAVDILSFAEAPWGLNMRLFPAQRFILKTYYGMELDGGDPMIPVPDEMNSRELTRLNEQDFMQYLIDTGRTNLKSYEPGNPRRELVLCCGRRGSKSVISSMIALYEVYRLLRMGNPQRYFGFPDGSEIAVCTSSTTESQASILFEMLKRFCMNCSYLKDRMASRSKEAFTLYTDNDREMEADPSIYMLCGGGRSNGIRGHSNIVVILDEAAFYPVSGEGNGDSVLQALTPSISSFTRRGEDGAVRGEGKIILLSSPFGKSGMFYRKYMESFDFQETMLMYNMYTSMINPTVDNGILRDEKKRNPAMFDCEYGAKFSDTVSSWVTEAQLEAVTDKSAKGNQKRGRPGTDYYMGIDYAGKNDGAAVAIVHYDSARSKTVLDYADVFYGKQSDVWWEESNGPYKGASRMFAGYDVIPLDGFVDEIARLAGIFPIRYGWFDQFNGYALHEMLRNRGLDQFEMRQIGRALNMQMYQICKNLICSELIEIPDHPILIPEMLLLDEYKSGASVCVEAPRMKGCHDDLSDAFVQAVYGLYLDMQRHGVGAAVAAGRSVGSARAMTLSFYRARMMRLHGGNDKSLYYSRGAIW